MKRTIQCNVYLTNYSPLGPEQLAHGNDREVANGLSFYVPWSEKQDAPTGWTLVGTAICHLDLVEADSLVANKVQSLRNEKNSILAAAQLQANAIEEKIQKLLSITYQPQS